MTLSPAFTATLAPGTYLFQGAAIGSGTSTVVFAERTFTVSSEDNAHMPAAVNVPAMKRTASAIHL